MCTEITNVQHAIKTLWYTRARQCRSSNYLHSELGFQVYQPGSPAPTCRPWNGAGNRRLPKGSIGASHGEIEDSGNIHSVPCFSSPHPSFVYTQSESRPFMSHRMCTCPCPVSNTDRIDPRTSRPPWCLKAWVSLPTLTDCTVNQGALPLSKSA